jgi:succinyl-diaminopimelate desuccinylase
LGDPADLALDLVAVPSVSGSEARIADLIAEALAGAGHLEVLRDGDAVVARTRLGRPERVIVAGHLDTVPPPVAGLAPRHDPDSGLLWGRGAVDMKGGIAVMAHLAAALAAPRRDVTWIFYDQEEVETARSGLGRLIARRPEWVTGDFAVLAEPTAAELEGGCNGTVRVEVTARGKAAHSARAWTGANAIHAAAPILDRLAARRPATVAVDGLDFREGLNAVAIHGGIAGNVVPDRCVVTVNYRFAPDKTADDAVAWLERFCAPFACEVVDRADGARPGLNHPAAAAFAAAVREAGGGEPRAKLGWTDVARFSALGIPAVNCGPGDPALAHADDERCPVEQIRRVTRIFEEWLT